MSPALNVTRFALLTLVALSLGTWGVRTFSFAHAASVAEVLPADGVVVVNFHGYTRCSACREIGTEAQALMETDFDDGLKEGTVHWRVVNFEQPANKHFIQEYGLTTSTVVVVRREAGRDVSWQRLDSVWEHLFDGPTMRAYLKEHITQTAQP
jgi:hypothetical protein